MGLPEGGQAAAAATGLSEGLAQHRPQTRAKPLSPRATAASPTASQVVPGRPGLRSRAQEVSLSLRQRSPVSSGCRLPGRRRSPTPSRRVVGCMTSSRPFSPPRCRPCGRPLRPQLSRSRHANFWLGTKGSDPAARGGRARLSLAARPDHPPLAGTALVAGGSPPLSRAATAAAPPGQPPWKPGSARRGRRGRRTGAGPTGSTTERGRLGRRQGLEAQAQREGLPRAGARDPSTSRSSPAPSLHTCGRRKHLRPRG